MELWALNPNLHLSSQDTLFCLITCLFALSFAQHALFGPIWLSLLVCSLHAFHISFVSFFACLLACFFRLFMYTHEAWTLRAKVRPPRLKKKQHGCKQEDASPQREMFSRLGDLALFRVVFFFFSFLLLLLLSLSPSLSLSLFSRACIRVPHHVPLLLFFLASCLGHVPQVWQYLFYISCILLVHTLGTLAMSDLFSRSVWLHYA